MRIFYLSLFVLTSALLISCETDNPYKNIKKYYFPLEHLSAGMVYEYRVPGNDSLAPLYTYYQTVTEAGTKYLAGVQYGPDLMLQQFSREEIISNGTLLVESFIYYTDTSGRRQQVPVEIEQGSIFPFEVRDSGGIFIYNVKWQKPSDTSQFVRVIRNRRYAGDTIYVYKNDTLPAVKFNLLEHIEDYNQGYLELEFSGYELYAKGLGLVYFKKNIHAGQTLVYKLSDTFATDILEDKFEAQLRVLINSR